MKSRFRFHLCCVCMLALAIAGCKVKRPDDVISESKMENLLYDYHLAKSMGDNLPYSENYKKALYLDAVFKKYGTTEATFDSSLVYAFVLPADTNYKDRDTLVWEVRYRFLEPMLADSLRAVTMAMQVIYEKDTLNRLETITDPGVYQLRLSADTLGVMKEIKGFIYYPGVRGEKAGALLADRFSLTRYHCSDSLSVAERDSINQLEALKTDSLKKVSDQKDTKISKDSLQKVDELKDNQRISPEEMNRRRTVTPEKKPEQIEVEQHIQQEKIEQRKERQLNQRRNQQRRQSPSR